MKEASLPTSPPALVRPARLPIPFAPSSEASRGVQRSEGFEGADTVARLIMDTRRHGEFKNQVIWVDEAGMLSKCDMNAVLAIANAQSARIILSGDMRQHHSVERGDALRIVHLQGKCHWRILLVLPPPIKLYPE